MKAEDLFFPVEKVPVDSIMPGYGHPSGITHAVIITKPDGAKRVVNYCSNLYHLIPNESVVTPFIKEVGKYYNVDVKYKMDNTWARFYIDVLIKNSPLHMDNKDIIFPKITLINSYDGSILYHFKAGFYRLLCSNGLSVPVGKERAFKGMHTPGIGNETNFEAIMAMASEFLASSEDLFGSYRELFDQNVRNPIMRIDEIMEETSFPKTLADSVKNRFQQELSLLPNQKANDWLIYNAFNYQLNHNEDVKTKQKKRDEIDQEILTYLLKY